MINRLLKEPALITGLVNAAIALFVAFGLDLTVDQVATIVAITSAILALLTRALVTPVSEVGMTADELAYLETARPVAFNSVDATAIAEAAANIQAITARAGEREFPTV